MSDVPRVLRLAVVQMECRIGEKAENIARSVAYLEQAAASGAQLVVLPELCDSGYGFREPAEARQLAQTADASDALRAWASVARGARIHVVAGFCERRGDHLFNSAAVIAPEGLLGTYRKTHLFGKERLVFHPGETAPAVFETAFGRIGVLICYDLRFPEAFRQLARRGADLICVPTNWVPLATGQRHDERGYCIQAYCAMAQANMSSVFVACADRIGSETGIDFLGGSLIVDNVGWPMAGPASADREEILHAEIEMAKARTGKRRNDLNDIWADRRLDLYHEP